MSVMDGHLPVMENSCSATSVERKLSLEEDPAARTIEFLRARLLSERSVSKAASQHARQLTKKVLELQHRLESEIQLRKREETARLETLARLGQDFTREYTDSADSNTEEDDFLGKSEGQLENDIGSSLRCAEMEELLQMQNMDIGCYTKSDSAKDISHKGNCRTPMLEESAAALTDMGPDRWGQMGRTVLQKISQASKEKIRPTGEELEASFKSASHVNVPKLDQEGWVDQVVDLLPSKRSQNSPRTREARIRQDQNENRSADSLQGSTPERGHKQREVTGDAGGKDGVILDPYQGEEGALSYDDEEVTMEKVLKRDAELIEKYEGTQIAQKVLKQISENEKLAVSDKSSQVINLHQRLEEGGAADAISQKSSKVKEVSRQTVGDCAKYNTYGSIQHLEGDNTQHLQNAGYPIVVAKSGSLVYGNVNSGLGDREQKMELSKVGDLNQSHSLHNTVKENKKTSHERGILSSQGDGQIRGDGILEAESQDKTLLSKAPLSEQKLQSEIASYQSSNKAIANMCSDQAMVGVDVAGSSEQTLEQRRVPVDMEHGRDTGGWPGVHHKRRSSSFKFNVHIDYSEEGIDFVEKDAMAGRSQATKIDGNSHLPSDLSAISRDSQQQGWLGVWPHTSGNLFSGNRPMVSAGRDVVIERQQFSQVDQINIDNVASTRDRQAGSLSSKDSHQTSLHGNYSNDHLASYVRQDQRGIVGSVSRGALLFEEPKQTIVTDMKSQGAHRREACLPPIYPYGVESRKEVTGSFSSTNLRSSSNDISQHRITAVRQPENIPVEKDLYDVGVGASSATSGQISRPGRVLGNNGFRDVSTSKTRHNGIPKHSSRALRERGFDGTVGQANYSKDSPWVEAFRRRIRQVIDPQQHISLGSSHEQVYYPARYGVGVQMVQSPYAATYFERSKVEHTPNFASRPSLPEHDWQSHVGRHVWQDPDPSFLNHRMPLDGGFDRVKDILKALQAVKQEIKGSSEQISFENHRIGYDRRRQVKAQAGRLSELPTGFVPSYSPEYVVPPYSSGVYSHINPLTSVAQSPSSDLTVAYGHGISRPIGRVMTDNRDMQQFARGEPLGRQNLLARADASNSYRDNIQGIKDNGRWLRPLY